MNDLAIYLLKVSAGIGFFVIPYLLFLRNDGNLIMKRVYLLSSLLFSWLMPISHLQGLVPAPASTPAFFLALNAKAVNVVSVPGTFHAEGGLTLQNIALILYFGGILFLAIRDITLLIRLKIIRQKAGKNGDVAYTGDNRVFAFFRLIYLPEEFKNTDDLDTILIHERAHIRQRHYIDLLFLEFTVLLTWFNPFTWLISRMIKENHEHLADREVLTRGISAAHYRAQLLNQILGMKVFRLGHPFNHSLTKKRFDMMKKIKFSRSGMVKFIVLVPAILFLFSFLTAGKLQDSPVTGTVSLSTTGAPAAGASVVVMNTTTGTVTDQGGAFSLMTEGKVKIAVSFLGYETKFLTVSPGQKIKVSLDPGRKEMDINNIPESEKNKPVAGPKETASPSASGIYTIVEEMPEFPGGMEGLRNYVYSHLEYPAEAKAKNLSGTAMVGFMVTHEGKVTDVHIIKSSNPVFNQPAVNVFANMPDWKPGFQRDHNVDVNLTVPVEFALRDKSLDK